MSHNWHPNNIEHEPMERRLFYASSPQTHPDVLRTLSEDPFWYIRNKAAENPSTPLECLMELSREKDFRIREAAEKTILHHASPCTFMLRPDEDKKWAAYITFPGMEGDGIKLAEEQSYPVELVIRRTDVNGSSMLDAEQCHNRKELLDSLNWWGQCRFSVVSLWDFDRESSNDPKLDELFSQAYFRRMEIVVKDMDEMFGLEDNIEPDTNSLDSLIHAARSEDTTKSSHTQEIEEERLPF